MSRTGAARIPVARGVPHGDVKCAAPDKEVRMGLFEQNPWLLIPIVIITVECWSTLKRAVKGMIRQWRSNRDMAR